MFFFTSLKQFAADLRRQKLRSLLTMFGIFWGSFAIVVLYAAGAGITEAQLKSQRGLGDNIAIYWPGITSKEYRGLPQGRRVVPTADDITLLKATSRTINRISPEFTRWNVLVKRGSTTGRRGMSGVWPEFAEMRNLIPDWGSRFLNDRDMSERRRVVFIGNILAKDFFGDEDPVGQELFIQGVPFTVVGVMKEKDQDSSYGGRDSRKLFIPTTTYETMYSTRYMNNFVLQPKKEYTAKQSQREVLEILGKKYRFDPDDTQALSVWDTTEGFTFLRNFFNAFSWFLIGIGITTLVTGAIGVSNIMNVVLEERTKEIGIKMALGARKSYILLQFISETLMITALGGFLGAFAAWLLVEVLLPAFYTNVADLTDYIGVPRADFTIGLLVMILLGIVGFLAGIMPARRAANLQPVQALKLF